MPESIAYFTLRVNRKRNTSYPGTRPAASTTLPSPHERSPNTTQQDEKKEQYGSIKFHKLRADIHPPRAIASFGGGGGAIGKMQQCGGWHTCGSCATVWQIGNCCAKGTDLARIVNSVAGETQRITGS